MENIKYKIKKIIQNYVPHARCKVGHNVYFHFRYNYDIAPTGYYCSTCNSNKFTFEKIWLIKTIVRVLRKEGLERFCYRVIRWIFKKQPLFYPFTF